MTGEAAKTLEQRIEIAKAFDRYTAIFLEQTATGKALTGEQPEIYVFPPPETPAEHRALKMLIEHVEGGIGGPVFIVDGPPP